MNGYTKDTFKAASTETKLNILFDCMLTLNRNVENHSSMVCPAQQQACNERFQKIEKLKWWNPVAAGVGGVFGGILGFMGKWFFFK